MQNQYCPLCSSESFAEYLSVKEKVYAQLQIRQYLKCTTCQLVYLNPDQRIDLKQEKARYMEHNNSIKDVKYCQFLLQAWTPLMPLIKQGAVGLDYGCGPQPVLAELIRQQSFNVDHYDPFFYKVPLKPQYDFILSTEVIEHVFNLDVFFDKLILLLKKGGYLSLMTDWLTKDIDFKSWRYREDKTHICFFSKETFEFIAQKYQLEVVFSDEKRVIVFQKK